MKYILALDQGTTSSRAILYNEEGANCFSAQEAFRQHYPQPGWVEHEPEDILSSQLAVARQVLGEIPRNDKVVALGLTNQRETTIVWDKKTGTPIYRAIVWQDRRTAKHCETLKNQGLEPKVTEKTGLLLDPYFSASKISWLLKNVNGAREKAERGEILFGTIDTWLVWHLTRGQVHATDMSNASRTLLFNIHNLQWDPELLKIFNIPSAILPAVKDTTDDYGTAEIGDFKIPVRAVAGDQQAALFGQLCLEKDMAKCTYGTGCFMIMNTGPKAVPSQHKLLTTIAWKIGKKLTYALEGSVFVGGAIIQWLRDELRLFDDAKESEALANQVDNSNGVVFVPALTGLGAPYWDPTAKGSIFGLTRGTTPAHITRAALESIALQVNDILATMSNDSGIAIKELRVDGGATANNLLMQLQANFSEVKVMRPTDQETTALGVAYLAGIACGLWTIEKLQRYWQKDQSFEPQLTKEEREAAINLWREAISRTKKWPYE
jgi:glycerol kinase